VGAKQTKELRIEVTQPSAPDPRNDDQSNIEALLQVLNFESPDVRLIRDFTFLQSDAASSAIGEAFLFKGAAGDDLAR
jgi:hypothetical protein